MVLRGGSDIKLRQPRSKKEKMVDNSKLRPWSELHEALLRLITKQLGAIDYIMFGCVCRGWRLHVTTHRQEFMASQPPLLVFLSTQAKRASYFYSIFEQRLYKAKLPNLNGKSCFGITRGYLVMEDNKKREDSQIWLLNPFTRHELHFPSPPNPYSRLILASLATPLQEFVIIAFCIWYPSLQFFRLKDLSWTVHDYSDKFNGCRGPSPWAIVDGAVLMGKLYVLTSYAEIGVLNLNSTPYVTLLEVKNTGYLHRGLQLLAYDEQLLMINGLMNGIGIMKEECQVYELNFMKMEWMRIQNFTDQALFLDYDMGSRFSNMTIWGWSQQYSNCIYNVGICSATLTVACSFGVGV
ncbi:uncharacterized protein LOC126703316 [Quercus robur]|uniref:uncharacterized protein LOC126703316 n=1 Tax=Quercus robur TaxID=38942 RepID=UPI0021620701|nr:uncharacterized protein LOC126703316 [Quercus robur]